MFTEHVPEIPERMRGLDLDEHGVPVPWCTAWIDGQPALGLLNRERTEHAAVYGRCTLCAQPLGPKRTFLLSPIAMLQGMTREPPAHLECMSFAACVCPQMMTPVRNRHAKPGTWCLWSTGRYDVLADRREGMLFFLYEADAVHWYCGGAIASRDAVLAAMDSAVTDLQSIGREIDGRKLRQRIERYIPTAGPE